MTSTLLCCDRLSIKYIWSLSLIPVTELLKPLGIPEWCEHLAIRNEFLLVTLEFMLVEVTVHPTPNTAIQIAQDRGSHQ